MIFGSSSGRSGGATAIDLTTGQQLWRRYLRSNGTPPLVKGGESHLVLVGYGSRVSLNAQTGQTIADSQDQSALPTILDLASGAVTEGKLELPSQDGPINLANYLNSSAQINFTAQNRPFLPTFDRVFLTYDNTTVTAWVAAP